MATTMFKKQGFAFITVVYWFLLVYIIAALVYWFIVLERQTNEMSNLRIEQLKKDAPHFTQQLEAIEYTHHRKQIQYIGEGGTFLVLIIIGSLFVYRAVRKQVLLSQQQQNFMMAVTHELKTPIAVAQLNLETLQKRRLDEAQQQKLIGNALLETNRLNSLTNNILVASQLEMGTYRLNKQPFNFTELVNNSLRDFRQRFPARTLALTTTGEVMTDGEATLLQMMVNNLLDNAIKYSPREAPVQVGLVKKGNMLVLTVADAGDGIPDAEKKRVFDKFYRIGSEATRTAKGTGLGLYLCRKIVKDHNGTIAIQNNQPKGAVFAVTLKAL